MSYRASHFHEAEQISFLNTPLYVQMTCLYSGQALHLHWKEGYDSRC